VETGVGFGWRVAKDSSGRTVYHHGGAVQGGRAMVMVWRDQRLAVAITTNLSPGARQVTERDAMALGSLFLP
jgi:serine beta-lactamase-like protein LACTB, mitochondrial